MRAVGLMQQLHRPLQTAALRRTPAPGIGFWGGGSGDGGPGGGHLLEQEQAAQLQPRRGQRRLAALLAIHDRHHPLHHVAGLAQLIHRLEGRTGGRHHVLQQRDATADRRQRPFQPGAGAVALGLLAHDQSIELAAVQRGLHRHGAHQRIGPQRQPGHRRRPGLHLLQQQRPQQRQAGAAEAHGLAIHIVFALAARRQGEAPAPIGLAGQQVEGLLALRGEILREG
jgi:hypothetical protein